ncbi:hypothetical protein OHD62_11030 [Mesorhizobium sp. YC-39]|uniref:hypothetical protein n=1 Tax=unclassified Mesorhizobium TaxID=325217 RepID=UPI0021E8B998|nr:MULTISPECIES: hypothetical protein [unclassified Mesorhizobium]MCV3207178.1 hypothetical protein [Mesorhizobium sp. YC-2]MCV3228905.1 hypothetical protein [Mesorhizobium sp. YC-39]
MTTHRISWGLLAARRIAAARGLDPFDGEAFARSLAPRILEIAHAIMQIEPRRGPREIALHQLREVVGRHAADIPDLVVSENIAHAAVWLLRWAQEGPSLAADNPKPERTLLRNMRMTVFLADGCAKQWDRVVEIGGHPVRNDGRR